MATVSSLDNLLNVAETANAVSKAVKQLRGAGNHEAANKLERESNMQIQRMITTSQRRRNAAAKARRARR